MALAHMKITVELREILLRNRPKSLYDISAKGTVPVLQIIDGNVIDESLDIMKWALDQGKQQWYNDYIIEQDQLISNNDSEFKHWLDRYKYYIRYTNHTKQYYQKKCDETLLQLELRLKKNNYLFGNICSLADVALFPFIRQFANVERQWFTDQYPRIDVWLKTWTQSNLFNATMAKYKQWNPENNPLIVDFT